MSKRYYRMTPARRAALKRAQQASAKKRRRRKTVAVTAISVAAVGGGAIGGYKVRQRKVAKGVQAYQAWNTNVYKQWATKKRPLAIENRKDVTRFGKTRIGGGVMVDKSGRQRGNRVGLASQIKGQASILVPDAKRGFKVASDGTAVKVGRLRGLYDNNRRSGYDRQQRSRKYQNWDKPRIQAKAAQRNRGKGKK